MYMTNQLNSLFNEVFPYRERQKMEYMLTDIKKVDENYVMEIDLPGVNKENIAISLEKGLLTVFVDQKAQEGEYLVSERLHGEYGRRYRLPTILTEEDIQASFKDGILTLTFPIEKKIEKKMIQMD